MRWLVVHPGPQFSVYDVYTGWVEALRELGETVIEFPLGDVMVFYDLARIDKGNGYERAVPTEQLTAFATDRLAAALYKIRPQVLLSVSTFFADGTLLQQARNYGTRVVLLMTEQPYETDRELKLAPHADLVLLNDPTNLAAFEAVAPTVYAPHAYRPRVHRPGPAVPDLTCDLGFAGTGYPSRVAFLEAMDLTGLDVKLAGAWMKLPDDSPLSPMLIHPREECMDNTEAVDLYRSAKASINLYRREANREDYVAGWSMGPREVELAATGCFFLRDPRGESDQVLHMLPTFTDPTEASDKLRFYLAHDALRDELARQAREAVADRTFTNHAKQLLRLLDRQPATV
jgi:spore maturation protein CgeB